MNVAPAGVFSVTFERLRVLVCISSRTLYIKTQQLTSEIDIFNLQCFSRLSIVLSTTERRGTLIYLLLKTSWNFSSKSMRLIGSVQTSQRPAWLRRQRMKKHYSDCRTPSEPWRRLEWIVVSQGVQTVTSSVCPRTWMWLQQVFSLWHFSLVQFLCAFPAPRCTSKSTDWRLKLTFLICSASPRYLLSCLRLRGGEHSFTYY